MLFRSSGVIDLGANWIAKQTTNGLKIGTTRLIKNLLLIRLLELYIVTDRPFKQIVWTAEYGDPFWLIGILPMH